MGIKELYELVQKRHSGISEHLPVLKQYGEECKHITEMGVRQGHSTLAFIMAKPDKLISYDIRTTRQIENIMKQTIQGHEFHIADSLAIEIEPTSLLFIDTLHTYNQLSLELKKHADKSNKYIILHDTETFGREDEHIYKFASKLIAVSKGKQGLRTAMEDFLAVNKNWVLHEDLKNNNGLAVLKRCG